jgi:hypothetical protein
VTSEDTQIVHIISLSKDSPDDQASTNTIAQNRTKMKSAVSLRETHEQSIDKISQLNISYGIATNSKTAQSTIDNFCETTNFLNYTDRSVTLMRKLSS